MEDFYSNKEDEDEDDIEDSSKSKRKPIIKLGFLGIEFKSEKLKKNKEQKREDLLTLLTDKTVEIKDSQEIDDDNELTPLEEYAIEQQIVVEHQNDYKSFAESETDEQTLEALEAVDGFHDKIISQNLDTSSALAETLAEIEQSSKIFENVIDLRINRSSKPDEITEQPLSLRGSSTESVKLAKNESVNDDTNRSTIMPIFDRLRNQYEPSKRTESKSIEETNTVSRLVERFVAKKKEEADPDMSEAVIKRKIEKQVARIETEIKTKELTIKQAAIENSKLQSDNLKTEVVRIKAPEADRLHASVTRERIGKVLVDAEAVKSMPQIEVATLQPIDRHVETVSRADLLELSAKTVVDGTTLRQVYETNLITEKGLRRVLIEHLRGGDIKRALKRELIEREKDFERDPIMRDKFTKSRPSSNVLNNLILNVDSKSNEQPNQNSKILNTQININTQKLMKKKVKVSWFDIVMLIFIGVLLTIVLTLVINR